MPSFFFLCLQQNKKETSGWNVTSHSLDLTIVKRHSQGRKQGVAKGAEASPLARSKLRKKIKTLNF